MRTPPSRAIAHQGVEDYEQLPHARHQSHLLGLAASEQPLVEVLDVGVVSSSDEGAHVEGGPHRGPAAPRLPLAASLPRVAVEGSDPHQGAQALVGDGPQLGQLGQERARQDWADAGDALEKRLVLLEDAALLDGFIEIAVGAGELFLEPLRMRPDAFSERRGSHLEAVVFGGEHREQLAPPGEDVLQSGGLLVGERARRGTDGLGETGEDEGVYSVGLGEAADGLGEVPRLARVDDSHGDPGGGDGGGGQTLVSSGGLKNDQFDVHPFEAREEFIDALLLVGDREGLAIWQGADVEAPLGYVDADQANRIGVTQAVSPFRWRGPGLADTGLLSTAGAAAPATVRAPPKLGRDDGCFSAVLAKPWDQGGIGLSRPYWPHCERPKPRYKEEKSPVWKRRLIEVFAIITVGDGLIEFLAPEEHSRLWVVGPKRTRRIGMWFVEEPDRMRVLGAAQVVLGVWLALRQHRDI
jgi:hypothetical protein